MGDPQSMRSQKLRRHDGGKTLASQDPCEGFRTLPRNPVEFEKSHAIGITLGAAHAVIEHEGHDFTCILKLIRKAEQPNASINHDFTIMRKSKKNIPYG